MHSSYHANVTKQMAVEMLSQYLQQALEKDTTKYPGKNVLAHQID